MKFITRLLTLNLIFVLTAAAINVIAAEPVNVADVSFTVQGLKVSELGYQQVFDLKVEYEAPNGIQPGDSFNIEIDNATNDILHISGLGSHVTDLYSDWKGKVGEVTYSNENGNYLIKVTFDSGYSEYFSGSSEIPHINGYFYAWVFVDYKSEVVSDTDTKVTIITHNGNIEIPVTVKAGGLSSDIAPGFNPGPVFGKHWRYGEKSGNIWDAPTSSDGDFSGFDTIRWYISVGLQNLTNRDMRASGGTKHWTTKESLEYSGNTNENKGSSYNTAHASYLSYPPYYPFVNEPFHYYNAVVEDFLEIGPQYEGIDCSAHGYLEDSVRIIRIMGSLQTPSKGGFQYLVDDVFLKDADAINRYDFFPGKRGLTIPEFFTQMKNEGQFSNKNNWSEIIAFNTIPSNTVPNAQIEHFKLELGNMYFDNNRRRLNIRDSNYDLVFSGIPMKDLPFAYLIYFETKAAEAKFSGGGFNYYNMASFKHDSGLVWTDCKPCFVKYSGSGGTGNFTPLWIKTVDEDNIPVSGASFKLTEISSRKSEKLTTGIGGSIVFSVGLGDYTLTEKVPKESGLSAIGEIKFSVNSVAMPINLADLLRETDYECLDDIKYEGRLNIITKREVRHHEVPGPGSGSNPMPAPEDEPMPGPGDEHLSANEDEPLPASDDEPLPTPEGEHLTEQISPYPLTHMPQIHTGSEPPADPAAQGTMPTYPTAPMPLPMMISGELTPLGAAAEETPYPTSPMPLPEESKEVSTATAGKTTPKNRRHKSIHDIHDIDNDCHGCNCDFCRQKDF